MALSSLHDISDYSNYIDQRISRLNHLYQSLTITRDKHPSHHRSYNPYQTLQQKTPSLSRQPNYQTLHPMESQTLQMSQTFHSSPQSVNAFAQRAS